MIDTTVCIGMLMTTNILSCMFACWARKSATNLTDKAFTLALAANDAKRDIHTSNNVEDIIHQVQISNSMKTYNHSSIGPTSSAHNDIPRSWNGPQNHLTVHHHHHRNRRHNTFHGNDCNYQPKSCTVSHPASSNKSRGLLQQSLFNSDASNVSKSYSHAPPRSLVAARQASQR